MSEIEDFLQKPRRFKETKGEYLENPWDFLGRKELLEFYFGIRNFLNIMELVDEHYQIYTEIQEDGRFKMNPPIRSKEDKMALIEGILDGTIDMIATDHAPHSKEEKSKGLKGSAFGIVGIETAFSLMYTYFVKTNVIKLFCR